MIDIGMTINNVIVGIGNAIFMFLLGIFNPQAKELIDLGLWVKGWQDWFGSWF